MLASEMKSVMMKFVERVDIHNPYISTSHVHHIKCSFHF